MLEAHYHLYPTDSMALEKLDLSVRRGLVGGLLLLTVPVCVLSSSARPVGLEASQQAARITRVPKAAVDLLAWQEAAAVTYQNIGDTAENIPKSVFLAVFNTNRNGDEVRDAQDFPFRLQPGNSLVVTGEIFPAAGNAGGRVHDRIGKRLAAKSTLGCTIYHEDGSTEKASLQVKGGSKTTAKAKWENDKLTIQAFSFAPVKSPTLGLGVALECKITNKKLPRLEPGDRVRFELLLATNVNIPRNPR